MNLDLYRTLSEAGMNDNEPLSPEQHAAKLLSDILSLSWPSDTPGAQAYQLGYLKGLLVSIASTDPLTMQRLELHRDYVIQNNREMFDA